MSQFDFKIVKFIIGFMVRILEEGDGYMREAGRALEKPINEGIEAIKKQGRLFLDTLFRNPEAPTRLQRYQDEERQLGAIKAGLEKKLKKLKKQRPPDRNSGGILLGVLDTLRHRKKRESTGESLSRCEERMRYVQEQIKKYQS